MKAVLEGDKLMKEVLNGVGNRRTCRNRFFNVELWLHILQQHLLWALMACRRVPKTNIQSAFH
jgi:hypothetical protein